MLALALLLALDSPPAPPPPASAPSPADVMDVKPHDAKPGERCKVVVFSLVGRALPKEDAELPAILTEALASEIGTASRCEVTSQADIVAMLDYEKQKAVCTEGSDSCLAEIGQAFGAERVVAGTISKLGADYVVTAKLMNVKKGAVEQRAEASTSNATDLRRTAKNVGRRLFGAPDLPPDANAAATSTSAPVNALLWTGVGVAAVGVAAAGTGATLAWMSDAQLANPKALNKDATHTAGLVELGVAGGGVVVALVGAVIATIGALP